MHDPDVHSTALRLIDFVAAAPTPFHAVAESAERLSAGGFLPFDLAARSGPLPARGFVAHDGALAAWSGPESPTQATPFRIVGAHTDSPNLRVRPQPDTGRGGWQQLGVEVYGGALVNSWLDRDLGLAGRIAVRTPDGFDLRLLRVDEPLLRIPQLAIHLDREISERGLLLNRQQHLVPVWGLGHAEIGGFRRFLADQLEVADELVLAWDLMAFDLAKGVLAGRNREFIASARLDNLTSCFAAVEALLARSPGATGSTAVVSLFDHEEVGSESSRGANGNFLGTVLERLSLGNGSDREDHLRALARSACLSTDMAHATHPNYPERHDPDHRVALNGGPVVKINVNQRYATDGATQAGFEEVCAAIGVPFQRFVSRNDMACGSTIGPTTAAHLGIPTVDVGIAQLGMHSIREMCGSADPAMYVAAICAWLD